MPGESTIADVADAFRVEPIADGRAVLALGDVLDRLRSIPGESIPLILTSPPYNIGMAYEEQLPAEAYVAWCGQWLAELHRISTPTGALWLNLGYCKVPGRGTAVPIPYLLWDALEFHLLQEVVWFFRAGVGCRRRLSPRNEKLLWLVKDPDRYTFDLDAIRLTDVRYPNQRSNGRLRCNPLGRNPSDVWEIPRVTGGRRSPERTNHPAQMPLALAERAVAASSSPGDVVLDPFLGSGTTAIAALRLDRLAVGIERNPTYLEEATVRIIRASPSASD